MYTGYNEVIELNIWEMSFHSSYWSINMACIQVEKFL